MKSKEELFEEIEKLKEVNLVDYVCCTAGFHIDEERTKKENRSASSPKYVFVENEAGDKLLISRIYDSGRQQYVYKNLFNDFDKGNIFSFIKNRTENFSIPTAKKKIYNQEDSPMKSLPLTCARTGLKMNISTTLNFILL